MNWKQRLKKMKLDYMKDTVRAFFEASGGYSMKVRSYNEKTINGLSRAIIDWITFSGGVARVANDRRPWDPARKSQACIFGIFRSQELQIRVVRDDVPQESSAGLKTGEIQGKDGDDGRFQKGLKRGDKPLEKPVPGCHFVRVRTMDEFVAWFEALFGQAEQSGPGNLPGSNPTPSGQHVDNHLIIKY
ncbi:MAG TPA: hypothetical protein VG870_11005 [Chitinophagaceae bacterium]|nr:hypothetical protein [Chitinophagaceae bacterium]